jgi:hypothetical protein
MHAEKLLDAHFNWLPPSIQVETGVRSPLLALPPLLQKLAPLAWRLCGRPALQESLRLAPGLLDIRVDCLSLNLQREGAAVASCWLLQSQSSQKWSGRTRCDGKCERNPILSALALTRKAVLASRWIHQQFLLFGADQLWLFLLFGRQEVSELLVLQGTRHVFLFLRFRAAHSSFLRNNAFFNVKL